MSTVQKTPRGSRSLGALVIAGVLGVAVAAGGCVSKSERDKVVAEKQQMSDENQKLNATIESMKSESAEANATLAEVQKGLEEIRAKELQAIRTSIRVAEEGKASSARREQLQAELQTIRDAIRQNLAKLARLQKQNKESGVKIASLEALTEELKRSLEEKETTVATLESRVGELSKTVESQAATMKEQETTIHEGETKIAETTKELHTAYVAVASRKQLTKSGVVEHRGDILGVGGRWIETGKFDPEVFRTVDVTKDLEVEIPAPVKKVHVVTAQPKGSYEIVAADAKSSKLAVKDPAAFWKGDRYLVVMTD